MEQVLCVLGAGFSAPLNIPTMADFLDVARGLYRQDPSRYSHLNSVFSDIRGIAQVKAWMDSNQHNLEEVLSILEMEDYIKGTSRVEAAKQFIADVIGARPPKFTPADDQLTASNWPEFMMGSGFTEPGYTTFVACLLGLAIRFLSERSSRIQMRRSVDSRPSNATLRWTGGIP